MNILSAFKALILVSFIGCASHGMKTGDAQSSIQDPTVEVFFSNMEGPSSESGDCGGNSLWLSFQNENVVSAWFFEHEGGCDYWKMKVENLQYDAKSRKLSFDFYEDSVSTVFKRFTGIVSDTTFSCEVVTLSKESKNPIGSTRREVLFKRNPPVVKTKP